VASRAPSYPQRAALETRASADEVELDEGPTALDPLRFGAAEMRDVEHARASDAQRDRIRAARLGRASDSDPVVLPMRTLPRWSLAFVLASAAAGALFGLWMAWG
jgi:hypothetical protein